MPYTGLSIPKGMSLPELGQSQLIRWLVPVIYFISALAFLLDLQRDNTLAYGIIYSPLVATAVFHKGRVGLWVLAVTTCLLVIVGAFLPSMGPDLEDVIGNRVLSIIAIVVTAVFVRHVRDTRDRLVAETRRAEAAERIKSDVLGTLTEEIRNPLHSLLGVLTLTIAGSPPGQRQELMRVRSDARLLLGTIDSLIALSGLSDRGLRLGAVDLAMVASEAVASAAPVAKERQINVALPVGSRPGDAAAIGDPVAIRRILDSFLVAALRMAKPGETVAVTVVRTGNTVTALVSDPGNRLSPYPGGVSAAGSAGGDDSTGLVLSQRLAQAMGGSIAAGPGASAGETAICLRLRAA